VRAEREVGRIAGIAAAGDSLLGEEEGHSRRPVVEVEVRRIDLVEEGPNLLAVALRSFAEVEGHRILLVEGGIRRTAGDLVQDSLGLEKDILRREADRLEDRMTFIVICAG